MFTEEEFDRVFDRNEVERTVPKLPPKTQAERNRIDADHEFALKFDEVKEAVALVLHDVASHHESSKTIDRRAVYAASIIMGIF